MTVYVVYVVEDPPCAVFSTEEAAKRYCQEAEVPEIMRYKELEVQGERKVVKIDDR